MDAGSAKPIVGLRTQGRKGGSNNQRVTSYKVKTSLDGRSWTYVDGGKVFAANKARSDTTVANKFSAPVTARYVRIIVESWKRHASMRAALDVGKHCSGSAGSSSGGSVRSLSLQNSWKPYGHGYEAPSTTKYGSLCVVSGLIKRNGMKNPLLTLPADCRPNKRVIFSLNNHQYQERVDVLTNGQVHYVAGTWRHNWLNLDGIQFAVSGQHSLSTQSGWKGYGGSYKSPTYTKTGSVCEVEGLVKHGRWGQPMVTLPGNCRPKKRLIFNMNNHKKSCRVDVQTNGRVTWHAGGKDHHWVSLGGIMFSTHAGSTLSLRNHWKNYGGSYGSATVAKTGSLCLVSGLIKHGRWGHLATLPSDCRPKGRLIFNMNNHQHSARVDVLTNGQIKWVTGGKSHHWISLTGITIHRKQH